MSNWKKFKDNNIEQARQTRPWDFINPKTEYVSEEEADKRFSICKECPSLIKLTNQCKKCGCFMNMKVKLLNSKCPIEKW